MKSLELFAGAGGLGMGVTKAGFSQQIAVELDTQCCKNIKFNIDNGLEYVKDWNLLNIPIEQINFSEFRDTLDLLTSGPPCQPFSLGGRHNAFLDKRDMFPQTIRVVKETMPKAFMIENVKGLTRNRFSNYFEYIKLQLCYPEIMIREKELPHEHFKRLEQYHTRGAKNGLSYNIVSQVLNAADFGIPQKRERVFIIGFRSDLCCSWSFPNPTHSCAALIKDKLFGNYWNKNKVPSKDRNFYFLTKHWERYEWDSIDTQPWSTVREVVNRYPCPSSQIKIPNHEFRKGARIYKGHTGSIMDEPSKTLKAGAHGIPGGENMLVNDDGSVRYFTLRECARLQSFPDEYIFSCSWSHSVRQVGNAVPLELSYVLALSIKKSLKECNASKRYEHTYLA